MRPRVQSLFSVSIVLLAVRHAVGPDADPDAGRARTAGGRQGGQGQGRGGARSHQTCRPPRSPRRWRPSRPKSPGPARCSSR